MYWGYVTKNTQIPNGNRDDRITGGGVYANLFCTLGCSNEDGEVHLGEGGGELTTIRAPNA